MEKKNGLGLLRHIPGILFNQKLTWERIGREDYSVRELLLSYLLPMAIIAPIAAYLGTTLIGWRVADGEPVRLTQTSALTITVAYFVGIVLFTLVVAKFIEWMSDTYGNKQPLAKCLTLTVFSATPLYLAGVVQAYPVIWVNYLVGLPLLGYAVYLMFSGMTHLLQVHSDRAFLFGSAVLVVGLVSLVSLLAATAVFWGIGIGPEFRVHD